jgi:hypothetical protein
MNPQQQTKIAALLKTSAETIREQAVEIEELRNKVAAHDRRAKEEKLASLIHEKGLSADSREEIIGNLSKLASSDLEKYAAAVEISSPNLYSDYISSSPHKVAGESMSSPGNRGLTALDLFVMNG